MSDITRIGIEIWRILLDSSPYIILGILAAGGIKVFVNQQIIVRHLQYGRYRSVFKAALLGTQHHLAVGAGPGTWQNGHPQVSSGGGHCLRAFWTWFG